MTRPLQVAAVLLLVSIVALVALDPGAPPRTGKRPPVENVNDVEVIDGDLPAPSAADSGDPAQDPVPGGTPPKVVLPEYYRGDVAIEGVVVDHQDRPVPGATVMCRVSHLTPFTDAQSAALVRKTNADGEYEFANLPHALFYRLRARHKVFGVSGPRSHSPDDPRDQAPIRLKLKPLYFEFFRFLDENNKPVRVDGHRIPFRTTGYLYTSMFRTGSALRMKNLLGLREQPAPNELIIVLAGRKIEKHRDWDLSIPGFAPRTVRVTRSPMSDWPKAQTVILRRDAASPLVAYRVQFPAITPPEGWEDALRNLKIRAAKESGAGVTVLRVGENVFYAPRGDVISLSVPGLGKLSFSRSPVGHETLLKPELPDFGFVELRYGPAPGAPERPLLETYVHLSGGVPLLGRMMHPGIKRFGPLPVGQYRLARRWADRGESSNEYRFVEVKKGLQVIEWK